MVPETDLHGFTKDEALAEVDRAINHSFVKDTDDREMRFVTGWGGVLRPAVHKFLTSHPLVKETRVDGPCLKIILEDL